MRVGAKLGVLYGSVVLVALIGVASFGATIHVPGDYATIQEAVDAAVEGDTILVATGTYDGFFLDTKIGITLQAEPGAVITGTVLINDCTDVTLDGFQISSEESDGIVARGCNTNLTIRRCMLVDCHGDGIVLATPGSSCWTLGVVIEECTISGNEGNGITIQGRTEFVIKDNTISENGVNGIAVGAEAKGTIRDNKIYGNGFAGIHPS